ncbi:MAG TPA: MFS transporter [Nocardioidaceae bacterium]
MTSPTAAEVDTGVRRDRWVTLGALLLVALNLRIAITSVSPVLAELRDDLGLSRGAAGLLTTLPVVCFGLVAPLAAALGRRLGNERALGWALVALVVGILVRSAGDVPTLFAGTVLLGSAIALGNVLVPALVKQDLSEVSGPAMSLYTVCLTGGAAIAAGGAAALASMGWTWRAALAAAALPALLAVVAFTLWAWRRVRSSRGTTTAPALLGGQVAVVWRSRTAWQLALFLAAQSTLFYSVLAWLPLLLQERGVSVGTSGLMLSTYNLLGIVGALAVPRLLRVGRDQRAVATVTMAGWIVGLAGLWALPGWYPLWSALLGVVQGAGITVALTLVVLRARDSQVARELSGMVQTTGYLMAAGGPALVGSLRDGFGGWGPSFVVMIMVGFLSVLAARGAGRGVVVG